MSTLEEVKKEIDGYAQRPGSFVSEKTTPISKAKEPVGLEEYYEMNRGFDFWSMQLAGDYAAYYYTHIPQYMHQQVIMPNEPVANLERSIDPRLAGLTFTKEDGSSTAPLQEYLAGPSRKQAMMMAHKGKVVFEEFPGMNANDMHLWMSSGKTTIALIFSQLVAEGKISLDDMCSKHVPALQGTEWDKVPLWAAASMNSALDIEETPLALVTPGSWITNFDFTMLGTNKTPYTEQLRAVKPYPNGEKPGEPGTTRYSSGNTLVLQYNIEAIEKKPFGVVFQERVWSKVGFRNPAFLCLAPDGTGVGYGMFSTTPEDMLKYAMLHTPSGKMVLNNPNDPVVTEKVLKVLKSAAKAQAYQGSFEQGCAHKWFGVKPPSYGLQWDVVFDDGAMFKHGNNGQGIYVDPKRDFCAMNFGVADNNAGTDYGPGYMRAAAIMLAGE